jgi:hypothetical protein
MIYSGQIGFLSSFFSFELRPPTATRFMFDRPQEVGEGPLGHASALLPRLHVRKSRFSAACLHTFCPLRSLRPVATWPPGALPIHRATYSLVPPCHRV